ncbi:unnamed protein product [Protopolystoma xenopodis]|uniref:C2H2-type domain-containing protein n=1 Tax=Protopolystoma xenopodis TaxID=117903 RepID=A0A448WZV5_9PLAT|nr:unnamed protein product [Protopolystoma xenopodis]
MLDCSVPAIKHVKRTLRRTNISSVSSAANASSPLKDSTPAQPPTTSYSTNDHVIETLNSPLLDVPLAPSSPSLHFELASSALPCESPTAKPRLRSTSRRYTTVNVIPALPEAGLLAKDVTNISFSLNTITTRQRPTLVQRLRRRFSGPTDTTLPEAISLSNCRKATRVAVSIIKSAPPLPHSNIVPSLGVHPTSTTTKYVSFDSSTTVCVWCRRALLPNPSVHHRQCSRRPNLPSSSADIRGNKTARRTRPTCLCRACGVSFSTESGLTRHRRFWHACDAPGSLRPRHPPLNNKRSVSTTSSPLLLKEPLVSSLFSCPGCSLRLTSLEEITTHILSHPVPTLASSGSSSTLIGGGVGTTLTNSNCSGGGNGHHSVPPGPETMPRPWPVPIYVPNFGFGCSVCGQLVASESRLDKHKKAMHMDWLASDQANR